MFLLGTLQVEKHSSSSEIRKSKNQIHECMKVSKLVVGQGQGAVRKQKLNQSLLWAVNNLLGSVGFAEYVLMLV